MAEKVCKATRETKITKKPTKRFLKKKIKTNGIIKIRLEISDIDLS